MMLDHLRKGMVDVLASRHIAGLDISDALPVCRWANEQGFCSIVSPWRRPQDSPTDMVERYTSAIRQIFREELNCYVSMKLDALDYNVELFDNIIRTGRDYNVRLHIDSLGPDKASTALAFVERAAQSNRNIGYTLASRWRRSLTDTERIVELGIPVRIVKGQWEDPGARGFDHRKNYLEIASRLTGRSGLVGIATHDLGLARETLEILSSGGSRCELEQFFSLPLNGIDLTRKFGYPYRIYVAYGSPGIPYNTRFALSRPSIAAWVLADFALHRKRPWASGRH